MPAPLEVIETFRKNLDPYIKPREQVNYIRRILALQLSSYAKDSLLQPPLSLSEGVKDVESHVDVSGTHWEYLEALRSNSRARREFEQLLATNATETTPCTPTRQANQRDILDEHLKLLKLYQRRERLTAVRDYLDELFDKPAASPNFLDIEEALSGIGPLPIVPQQIVNNLAEEQIPFSLVGSDRVKQLEKILLRARLRLKAKERLLSEARARLNGREAFSNSARLNALHNVRNEMIRWIESELGRPSKDEVDGDPDDRSQTQTREVQKDQTLIDDQLQQVQERYKNYVKARKELLDLTSQRPEPLRLPVKSSGAPPEDTTLTRVVPTAHLLTPYVEALLSTSAIRKSMISQKAHMKTSLVRHTQDACQVLGHLAEESQLLPLHPMKESLRRRSGLFDELTAQSSDHPDLSKRVIPWVFATDSAKIATLEVVASAVEDGQIALENSIKALQGIYRTVGQGNEEDSQELQPGSENIRVNINPGNGSIPGKQATKAK